MVSLAARLEEHFENWVSHLFHLESVIRFALLINMMEQLGMG